MLKKYISLNKRSKIALILFGSIFFFSLGLYVGTRDYSRVEALKNDVNTTESPANDSQDTLNPTAQNLVPTVDPLSYINENESCVGNWVNINSIGQINLDLKSLNEWRAETAPMVISETKSNNNIVAIGHNICTNGDCFSPGSQFGNLINTKVGDYAEICVEGKLNKGYVVVSEPKSEYDVHILSDWLSMPSVTLFTSYGNCKDTICSSTEQRWVVAFGR